MPCKIKVVAVGYASDVVGSRSQEIVARPGMTLRDLLAELSNGAGQAYGKAIYDKGAGRMNEYLTVFVNSREVRSLRGLDTILEPGDVVTLMPPMAGGAACPHV